MKDGYFQATRTAGSASRRFSVRHYCRAATSFTLPASSTSVRAASLYISRGVGHLLHVRFNVRPEVTVFELRSPPERQSTNLQPDQSKNEAPAPVGYREVLRGIILSTLSPIVNGPRDGSRFADRKMSRGSAWHQLPSLSLQCRLPAPASKPQSSTQSRCPGADNRE